MTYSVESDLKSGFAYELIASGYGFQETIGAIQDEVNRLKRQIEVNKVNPHLGYPEGDIASDISTLEIDITILKEASAKDPNPLGFSRASLDVIGDAITPIACKVLLAHAISQIREAINGLNPTQWGRKQAYETKLGHLTRDLDQLEASYPSNDPHSDIAIRGVTVRDLAEALEVLEVERPTLDTLAIYVLVEFTGLDKETEFVRLYEARIAARNILIGYGYMGEIADSFVFELIKTLGFINLEHPTGEA